MNRGISIVFVASLIGFSMYLTISSQPAFACSCAVHRPQVYEESTAVFVGKVIDKDYDGSLIDRTMHVTFDVQKSWKGVNAKTVTVHLDSPACSTPFLDNEDYLVYAYVDVFEVKMPTCSGTSWMGNVEYLAPDILYLDEHYSPIAIRDGISTYEGWQILGVLVGISIAAFFAIARRKSSAAI